MKFIVDAHLPRRIVFQLRAAGYDAVHTLDLPNANRSTDVEILQVADQEGRIVVTKDADFVNTFTLYNKPKQLLLISTGNITNQELNSILISATALLQVAFTSSNFVELTRSALIVHN